MSYGEGSVGKEGLLQKVREYEEEEEKVVLKMAELEAMLQQRGERLAVMRHLRHFCEEARRRIHSLDQGQKARFIRYLVDEIVLDSNRREAKIVGHIPLKNEEAPYYQHGTLSTISSSHGQCPSSWLRFEMKAKV